MIALQREEGKVFVTEPRIRLLGLRFLAERLQRKLADDLFSTASFSMWITASEQTTTLYLSDYSPLAHHPDPSTRRCWKCPGRAFGASMRCWTDRLKWSVSGMDIIT